MSENEYNPTAPQTPEGMPDTRPEPSEFSAAPAESPAPGDAPGEPENAADNSETPTSDTGDGEASTSDTSEQQTVVGRRSVDEQLAAAGLPQPPSRGAPGFGATRGAGGAIPGEVVEYYEPGFGHEVVETYTQPLPLPGRAVPAAKPQKRRKPRKKGLWIFLSCTVVLAALAVGAYFWAPAAPSGDSSAGESSDAYLSESEEISIPTYKANADVRLAITDQRGPELTAQEIYQRTNPSVVTVLVQLGNSGASVGTGVIFTSDGYVLTNYHVLAGGTDCTVTLANDVTYSAKYVAGDADNDLAILKVDADGLPAADIGSSDDLVVGEKVYAIGNPLGVELRGTFTDGIVSAINRDVDVDGRTMTLVQTNAALNSGNSGGPLINSAGQVVGINTIKMSSAFASIEGLGFAIPSSSMQYIVNDLLQYGSVLPQPLLGISVAKTGTTLPDGRTGIKILEVSVDSAAEKAGLLEGDVLVNADGDDISSSVELLRVRRRFHVGDSMDVTVYRSGAYRSFTLELQDAAD